MKILFAVFLFFVVSSAIAESSEPVVINKAIVCGEFDSIINRLTGKTYREYPMWIGDTEHTTISLFVNTSTGTWTLLEHNNEVGCILGAGEAFLKGNIKYDA